MPRCVTCDTSVRVYVCGWVCMYAHEIMRIYLCITSLVFTNTHSQSVCTNHTRSHDLSTNHSDKFGKPPLGPSKLRSHISHQENHLFKTNRSGGHVFKYRLRHKHNHSLSITTEKVPILKNENEKSDFRSQMFDVNVVKIMHVYYN